MICKKILAVLLVSVLLVVSSSVMAATGKIGFGTEATISGFFSPVLRRVKITTVVQGSPAAAAGVMPGDYIIEANGRAIDGAPAREMAKQLKDIEPGAHLRLKLKRGDAFVVADIVAGA